MITFKLDEMNAPQLARLYKLLVSLYRLDDAEAVLEVGTARGIVAFCEEIAKA